MTKWTGAQEKAIAARNCNLLVSAAAGSGKTAVLSERIIQRVLDKDRPVDIDRLLVVTFTKAAASEMKQRISDALALKLKESTSETKNIRKQMLLLNRASIMTLHSYCQRLIRNNYVTLGIDPAFRILDDIEEKLLKSEALDRIFDNKYKESNTDDIFFNLIEAYCSDKSDQKLKDIILDSAEFINSSPFPKEWMDIQTEKLKLFAEGNEDFSETIWGKLIVKDLCLNVGYIIDSLTNRIDSLEGGFEAYGKVFLNCRRQLEELYRSSDDAWDAIRERLNNYDNGRLPPIKGIDEDVKKEVTKEREDAYEFIKKYRKIFNEKTDEIRDDTKIMYPFVEELCRLICMFYDEYSEMKNKRCALDFSDLEHLALKLLSEKGEDGILIPSKAALLEREYFDEVYTDEYQDTNLTQETILNLVSRDGEGSLPNRFMVGDIKQSIYRFRQARPDIFLEKYNSYSKDELSRNRLVILDRNFRSRKDVLGSVNYIFSKIMSLEAGEMEYGRSEYLYYSDMFTEDSEDGHCELLITETNVEDSGDNSEEKLTNVQSEARMVAKRIIELTDSKQLVLDKATGRMRPVRFGDIVILLRSMGERAKTYAEELFKFGIPVYCEAGSGFYSSKEVMLVISLLKIVDNPLQDIPVAAVLRSPLFGFSDNELVRIRLSDREDYFYNNLKRYVDNTADNDVLRIKISNFLKLLETLRNDSLSEKISDLIEKIYNMTGFYTFVGRLNDGEKRTANLRKLVDNAIKYEETGESGIFSFLKYIDKSLERSRDDDSSLTVGENDNVVRIMSIHKSKGLEFPVVIIGAGSKKFNIRDFSEKIILHEDMGFGMDYIDIENRYYYQTPAKMAISMKCRNENIAEEMRILYVAMTRAKEKLIIAGTIPDLHKYLTAACFRVQNGRLSVYHALNAKSYFDWLLPVIMRHPDMKKLREIAGISEDLIIRPQEDEDCRWKFKLFKLSESEESSILYNNFEEQKVHSREFKMKFLYDERSLEAYKEVSRRLDYSYRYSESTKLPSKLTVSEIKRIKEDDTSEDAERLYINIPGLIEQPSFMSGRIKKTAAEKGSATHFLLQNIKIEGIRQNYNKENWDKDGRNYIESQLKELVLNGYMTEEEEKLVDINSIFNFFKSELGIRMVSSRNVYREVPFTINMRAKEIYSNINELTENEIITVQGIIDCFFEEDNGIILIDYKTDNVKKDNIKEYAKRYNVQLDIYEKALMKTSGKKVNKSFIYFLACDCYCEI